MTSNARAYLFVAFALFVLTILCGCGGGDFRDGDPDSMTREQAAARSATIQPIPCDVNPAACS